MLKHDIYEFKYGNDVVKLEWGVIARQANSSVMVSIDDTVLIVTLVYESDISYNKNFLPLSVYYQEKFYSAGKIPGGFFRREGRSNDNEIIISRLMDRAIRPLFSENFLNEIQIVISVLSIDKNIKSDILSFIGVSVVLALSGIPDMDILGGARIGLVNNKFILNPTINQISISKLNLVVAGTSSGITLIDVSSDNLEESLILDAVYYAFNEYQEVIKNVLYFCDKKKEKRFNSDFKYLNDDLSLDIKDKLFNSCYEEFKSIYLSYLDKKKRLKEINLIKNNVLSNFNIINNDDCNNIEKFLVIKEIKIIEKYVVVNCLLNEGKRIDKRNFNDIRDINIKVGFLPKRVHGSSLFTRGETQALVTVTLGTSKDAQNFNDIFSDRIDNFIFHYNFPPYSVGEVGNIGILKRREIGHGYLAKRGIFPILPKLCDFPYTIRIVSDILESNGSSSMASVCGASLALRNAGVPIKYLVSGVSMGLFKCDKNYFILSDIMGDEDRFGDMDFKIIGTSTGVTALQMDMKVKGIDCNIISDSLKKSIDSKLYILDKMKCKINKNNCFISDYAPRILQIKIDVDKIKYVIGKRGVVIKKLTDKFNCVIEVEDDGLVKIISNDENNIKRVVKCINKMVSSVKSGDVYKGKIIKIVDFGVFVLFKGNKEGLVHISKISNRRVNNIFDFVKLGQLVKVKVLEIDKLGRIRLSMKDIDK